MNNELDAQLAKVVEKSLQLAEQTGDFVIEQAPDLLKEFYAWHSVSAILGIVLGLVIMIGCFFLVKYSSKKINESDWDDIGWQFLQIGSSLAIIGGFIYLIVNAYNFVFITVAPKLYLIDYFLK